MSSSPSPTPKFSTLALKWRWLVLLAVVLIGLGIRLYALDDAFLWFDETEHFNEQVYGDPPQSLRRFAASVAQEQTVGAGWAIIIWLVSRTFGGTAVVARMPSVLFGTAAILAVFWLVFRVSQDSSQGKPFLPAIIAACLIGMSIVQIEFSQRIYPYATVPFLTTLIVILHLEIVGVIRQDSLPIDKFTILAFLYTLIIGFSIFLHMSFTIVIAGSLLVLLVSARRFLRLDREKCTIVLGISALTTLAIFLAWIGNAIHTQAGYRYYLAPYYHRLDFGAGVFLLTRAYDVLTYHLNLFYNGELYWPRQVNPVLIPLLALCLLGWCFAAAGKFGRMAKDLAILAVICFTVPAILSLFRKFPFGGVRQTLFLSPFLFTFTALGFYLLTSSRPAKVIGTALAAGYIVLWCLNLPHLYEIRKVTFGPEDILTVWENNEKLKFYEHSGCTDMIKYMLLNHAKIDIEYLPYNLPAPPFLLISTHWGVDDSLWRPDLQEKIREAGYRATLLMKREPAYPVNPDYRQSLYAPPNGLWIHKITKADPEKPL